MKVRVDSLYKWGAPIYDEDQGEYVWGICDPPKPVKRDDDRFHTLVEGDRFDALALKYLGDEQLFWIIMHYNNISDAMIIDEYLNTQIRIPSKTTVTKVYIDGTK